ncbi:MAG: glycosyltransferase family 39 protein [Candidatus Taylorbacteria bacterium]
MKEIYHKISRIWVLVTLLSLIFLGGILRFYYLSSQSYWMDEGYTVNAVMSISEHGSTILDSGQNYSCPTYCYPTAYLVNLFGNSPSSYRLLSVLAGLLFIAIIFLIARKFFNRNVALLTSFFVTFSYWQIAWSRQARWYTLFSLLFWLSLYFFYQSLYSNKNKYLNISLTAIFTVLAVITHGLGYLLPLIFIGWILIDQIFIKKMFNWKKSLAVVVVGAVIMWLFNLISNIDVISYLFNNLNLHYVLPYYLNFYLRTYWLFILFAIFAFFNRNNFYRKEIYFLVFILCAYLIPLSFFTNIVHYRYMFHLTPIFFMLGSLGIMGIHDQIKPKYGKAILWVAIIGLFATIAGGVFMPQTYYYLESDNPSSLGSRPHYASTPQSNWNSAYAFIKANKSAGDITISSHPQFNKIFLDEAGYWIKYNYLGFDNKAEYSHDDREYYVAAKIIDDIAELKTITASSHGFIVFDFMSITGRIPQNIQNYIMTDLTLVFHEKTNEYSDVWVYRF